MSKLHIKTGDTVVLLTGDKKDRNKTGKVLEVSPKEGKVIVEGINMVEAVVIANGGLNTRDAVDKSFRLAAAHDGAHIRPGLNRCIIGAASHERPETVVQLVFGLPAYVQRSDFFNRCYDCHVKE